MKKLANLVWLEGRTLIIEEPDSVAVDYDDGMGGMCAFYTQGASRVKILLPDFVADKMAKLAGRVK